MLNFDSYRREKLRDARVFQGVGCFMALLIGDRSPSYLYTQIIHTIYTYKFLYLKLIHTTSIYNFEL
jgi:hypothetical protein